jgi:hypothetical protein
MPRLSAVILDQGGDQDSAATIRSAGFADEVLLIHPGTADQAAEEWVSLGARLVTGVSGEEATWRWAIEQATHDWVLCLQAGELVTPELAGSIRVLLDDGEPMHPSYGIQLETEFMGRPLSGPAHRRTRVRLVDRRHAPTSADAAPSAATGRLSGAVRQPAFRNVSAAVVAMDNESTLAAFVLAMGGRRPGALTLLAASAREFLRHYLGHQGFRDGVPGLAWAILQALRTALTHVKAHDLAPDVASSTRPPRRRVGERISLTREAPSDARAEVDEGGQPEGEEAALAEDDGAGSPDEAEQTRRAPADEHGAGAGPVE